MDYEIHRFPVELSTIYILEFNEHFHPEKYLESLTDSELEKYLEFNNLKRQKEFVATRLLKHSIFGYQRIQYTPYGAPYFDDHHYISISHAGNLVGIASNPEHRIGFDLEKIDDKILRLFPKFMNPAEQGEFDVSNVNELVRCWSFKETLYKLAGRKEIHFKEELLLQNNHSQGAFGKIINPDEEIHVDLYHFQFKEYIVTINKSSCTHVKTNSL